MLAVIWLDTTVVVSTGKCWEHVATVILRNHARLDNNNNKIGWINVKGVTHGPGPTFASKR